jgi:hypothetical protein
MRTIIRRVLFRHGEINENGMMIVQRIKCLRISSNECSNDLYDFFGCRIMNDGYVLRKSCSVIFNKMNINNEKRC